MSHLRLAEQLALVQEYIKIDKSDFNRAMQDAHEVIQCAKQYQATLRKIKSMSKQLKGLTEINNLEEILKVLHKYPEINSLREAQVLVGMLQGKTAPQIAKDLHITDKTIKYHKNNIFKRCGKKSTIELLLDSVKKQEINQTLVSGAVNDKNSL